MFSYTLALIIKEILTVLIGTFYFLRCVTIQYDSERDYIR